MVSRAVRGVEGGGVEGIGGEISSGRAAGAWAGGRVGVGVGGGARASKAPATCARPRGDLGPEHAYISRSSRGPGGRKWESKPKLTLRCGVVWSGALQCAADVE